MHHTERLGAPRLRVTFALFGLLCLAACSSTKEHYVVAATGTVIGVEIAQSAANQTPQAKLGYNRSEVAIVPTNRRVCTVDNGVKVACEDAGGVVGDGAEDAPDVLMELRYGGIFDVGPTSGIYQRLAVGTTAVQQDGASLMFAKDAGGDIDNNVADQLPNLLSESDFTDAELARAKARNKVIKVKAEKVISHVQVSNASDAVDPIRWGALLDKAAATSTDVKANLSNLKSISSITYLRGLLTGPDEEFVDEIEKAM